MRPHAPCDAGNDYPPTAAHQPCHRPGWTYDSRNGMLLCVEHYQLWADGMCWIAGLTGPIHTYFYDWQAEGWA